MAETGLATITRDRIEAIQCLATQYAAAAMMAGQKPADLALKMHLGDALGFDPRVACTMLHVIEGKPALSAEAMRAKVLASGLCEDIAWEEGPDFCRCTVKRHGIATPYTAEWTMGDAKRAGLTGKSPWQKTPRAMLRARAGSDAFHAMFADVLAGIYSVEEMEDSTPMAPAPRATVTVEDEVARVQAPEPAREPEPDDAPDGAPTGEDIGRRLTAIAGTAEAARGKALLDSTAASEGTRDPRKWPARTREAVSNELGKIEHDAANPHPEPRDTADLRDRRDALMGGPAEAMLAEGWAKIERREQGINPALWSEKGIAEAEALVDACEEAQTAALAEAATAADDTGDAPEREVAE